MLSSTRALRVSLVTVAFATGGALLGPGCGGSGNDTTSTGSGALGGAGGTTGSTGFGGELFGSSSSNTGTGGTGGTGGSGPVCDPNPTAGPTTWAKRFGDAAGQYGQGVAIDAQGNVVVTGAFQGSMTLGNTTLTSAGGTDIFVAKFDKDGAPLWAKRFGDGKAQGGRSVALDATGNVVVTGYFIGNVNFGGSSFTSVGPNFEDIFLVKLDSAGGHVWSKQLGDISTQLARGVAVDGAGNIALVGEFQASLTGTPLVNPNSQEVDAFVVVYDPAGTIKWSKRYGDAPAGQSAHAVAFDKNGDLLVTGVVAGTIDFGMGVLSAPGTSSTFLAKLDSTGNTKWGKIFGQDKSGGEGVAADGNGNVFVTGDHTGPIDLGGGPLENSFGANVFVAKLDPLGAHVWSNTYGDDTSQIHVRALSSDAAGHAVIAGNFSGKFNFGDGAVVSGGSVDGFVAKFDKVGCQVWAKGFGDSTFQEATCAASDGSGNVVVTGNISGTVDFGVGALSGMAEDLFVTKYGP